VTTKLDELSRVDEPSRIDELARVRRELAAVLRWSARLKYQQGVCNHFSVMAPGSERLFLVNPEGLFWSEVTASSLLLCDLDGTVVEGDGTVELSAFSLHAPIHRFNARARAVLHTHAPYATALCLIEGAVVEPTFLAGLQFFGNIAYDETCHGAAFTVEEGEREARILGDKNILMMRNHGPIVVGPSVAAAFDRLYYLEETCQRQLLAMSANRPLRHVSNEIARGLADQVQVYDAYAEKHLTAIMRVLDREEPEYAS
jgi:ribulose-5-phosphate 4-epimerase/fuculose-1-phosphate aldolase